MNHMVASCDPAKPRTMNSRFGPVADVWRGMLLDMVLRTKYMMAAAVQIKAM